MKEIDQINIAWSGRGTRYTDAEIAFIVAAVTESDSLTQGHYLTTFEKDFCHFTGAPYAFAVSSCTSALELSALMCQLQKGDEVIIPSHTFAATAIPFARTGAKIVWADIDPDTWVVSAASIASLITPHTKAIVPVHLYGLMADMDAIMALAKQNDLLVVEDAAQAIGATYKQRQAGTIGDFGCFSFHTHKNMSTLGEGGMLTLRSSTLAAHVPGLRHNGLRAFTEERDHYWMPAMSNVDFDIDAVWPCNYSISEPQCAAGIIQLRRLHQMNTQRRQRAQKMQDVLHAFPEFVFQKTPTDYEHVHYCLPARYDGTLTGKSRDDFMARMAYHHGVKMGVQYCPLNRYPIFQKAGFAHANCPEADHLFDNMVSFPFQQWMPETQFESMIEATRETLEFLRN